MILILIILAFADLGNAVHSTSGCSLLPNGSPKCFPELDYRFHNHLREIKYQLDNKHIFAKDTNVGAKVLEVLNYDVKDLRLGKRWVEVVRAKKDTVTCTISTEKNAYLPEYLPYLYDYSPGANNKVAGKTLVTRLFQITKTEVWSCKDMYANGLEKFIRVVTEMVSRAEIGTIYFFDGIEVTKTPKPWLTTDDITLYNTIVREIKYIDPKDRNKVVRYDGRLEFEKVKYEEDEDTSLFKPVVDNAKLYQWSRPHQTKEYFELESDAEFYLEDIHRPLGSIGQKESTATCRLLKGDKRLFNFNYLPHWGKRILYEGGYRLQPFNNTDFEETFIVTKHVIWSCEIDYPTHVHENGKFEAHILEYIGLRPVKTMDYYYNYLYKRIWKYDIPIMVNEESFPFKDIRQSVGIESISFYTDSGNYQRKLYLGELKHVKNIVTKEEPKKKCVLPQLIKNLLSSENYMSGDQYKVKFSETDDSIILCRRDKGD